MRKLILRIRHWLIRILGGYTEQQSHSVRLFQYKMVARPIRVEARCKIGMEFGLAHSGFYETEVKTELARLIAHELVFKMGKEILIECRDDEITMQKEYRTRVYIMPGTEAAKLEGADFI